MRLVLLLLLLNISPLSGCALYRAEEIEGTVVDSTGPVADVVVVAHWELRGGFMDQRPVAELRIMETVTDASGRFSFPAWGPVLITGGELAGSSPGILIFKNGYLPRHLSNLSHKTEGTSQFHYNKSVTMIDRFGGTIRDYSERLANLNSTLQRVGYDIGRDSGDYCGWRQFPRMLKELELLDVRLQSANASRGVVGFLKANDARVKERCNTSALDVLSEKHK